MYGKQPPALVAFEMTRRKQWITCIEQGDIISWWSGSPDKTNSQQLR